MLIRYSLSIINEDLHSVYAYAQKLSREGDEALKERMSECLFRIIVISGNISQPVCLILYLHEYSEGRASD